METKQMIIDVLLKYGCVTTSDIAYLARKRFGENLSLPSIAGNLRTLVTRGFAAHSPNSDNRQVYWLTDYGETELRGCSGFDRSNEN